MMTETERRKIHAQMKRELDTGPAIVWKSAAMLVILLLLVLIGSWTDPTKNHAVGVTQPQSRQTPSSLAEQHQRNDVARPVAAGPLEATHTPALAAGSNPKPAQ